MVKKNLFCIFLAFIISSGIAHGSDYANLNENRCCYHEREDDPTSDRIVCRTRSCKCSACTCCVVSFIAFAICGVSTVIVYGRLSGTIGSNELHQNNSTSANPPSLVTLLPHKPSVPAMQRDSGFEQLHSQSNSTHAAPLLKKNNKKKQS